MCKRTDEQIGKIIRGAFSEVVDLMAEETHQKLLGFPRYEKCNVDHLHINDPAGFLFTYAIIWRSSERESETRNYLAFFRDEETCDRAVKLFNKHLR